MCILENLRPLHAHARIHNPNILNRKLQPTKTNIPRPALDSHKPNNNNHVGQEILKIKEHRKRGVERKRKARSRDVDEKRKERERSNVINQGENR